MEFLTWVQAKIFRNASRMAAWPTESSSAPNSLLQVILEITTAMTTEALTTWPVMSPEKKKWSVSIMYMNHDCWLAFLAHDYQQMEVANTTPTRLTKEIHAQFRPLQPTTTWPHPVGDHYYIPLKTNDSLINLNSQRCDFLNTQVVTISSVCINEQ